MFPPGSSRLLLCEVEILHKVHEQSFLLDISPLSQGSLSSTASFSSHLLLKIITIKKDSLYLKFFHKIWFADTEAKSICEWETHYF
jgi:hypothetical protein